MMESIIKEKDLFIHGWGCGMADADNHPMSGRKKGGSRQIWRHMLEIQRRVGNERDPKKLFPLVIAETSKLLNVDRSSLFLMDWDNNTLRAEFAQGAEGLDIRLVLRMGVAGAALLRRQVMNVANAYENAFFNKELDQAVNYRTESLLAVPILGEGEKALGCVELLNNRKGRFSRKDENMVRILVEKMVAESGHVLENRQAARKFIEELCRLTQCDRGSLFTLNEVTSTLDTLYATGLEENRISLSVNLGVAGLVAVTGAPLVIDDAVSDLRFDSSADERSGYRTRSILCVPLITGQHEVIGVLEAINKLDGHFSQDDLSLLEGVASVITIAIENALLLEEQEWQFRSLLQTLAASIDAKDTLTAGHSTRVMEYSVGIAQELGFDKGVIDVLEVAALLHDYGKIGIDDMVLKKPGRLTPDEYRHIQQHVTLTRSILDKIRFARKYRMVPLIASSHHEALDGTGYGEGLLERDIPFLTRIITVADVFEALTAIRHYRTAMPIEQAFAILEEGLGTKFDPIAVDGLRRFWQRRKGKEETTSNHP